MELVRRSRANGFTAASPPPSLSMCKSIHRVLMAPATRDTDPFKWPGGKKQKWESFTHLQSWQKNNSRSVLLLNRHFFYLKMVQMFVYWFKASRNGPGGALVDCFAGDDCVACSILSQTHSRVPLWHGRWHRLASKQRPSLGPSGFCWLHRTAFYRPSRTFVSAYLK